MRVANFGPFALLTACSLAIFLSGCGGADPVAVNNGKGKEASGTTRGAETKGSGTSSGSGEKISDGSSSQAGASTAVANSASQAELIISQMAQAYRTATSYEDNAVYREVVKRGDAEPMAYETPLYITYEAPNKFRAQIGGGMIVSDGNKILGSYYDVPGYVAQAEAPERLTPQDIFFDPRLGKDQLPAIQVGLLLNDGMADVLIGEAAQLPELLEPGDLDGVPCYRVRFLRRMIDADEQTMESEEIYWIDQANFVLRRIEVPAAPGEERSIEFVGAKLNSDIPEVAFKVDLEGSKVVKRLIPPRHAVSLGAAPDSFEFTTLDGNKITKSSVNGKVTLLDFWVSDTDGICVANLPRIAELHEKYSGNSNVEIVSINIDPNTTNEDIAATIKDLNLPQTVAHDSGETPAVSAFGFGSIPYAIIMSADGIVQYCEMGYGTAPGDDPVARFSEKIDAILAGEGFAQEIIAAYEEEMTSDAPTTPTAGSGAGASQSTAAIAPATEPQSITLQKLWAAPVAQPGNMLVVPGDSGPRIFVHEGYQGLVELNSSGEIVTRPDLKLGDNQVATFTRTALDSDGNRYYALAAVSQLQARVYDKDWNLVMEYPEAGTDHAGIADVQLVNMSADGKPLLAIGYFDVVGVHAVELDGQRAWWNRSLRDVMSMAASTAMDGSPLLLCCNTQPSGALASIKADGERGEDIQVADKFLRVISGADLNADGFAEYCGLAFTSAGSDVAVGFTPDGAEMWTYPLPPGQHPTLIQIGWGKIVGDSPHWIFAGADGTVHFIAAGGLVLDSFATGKEINGFAAAEVSGSPVLLISTADGVEAWGATPK